MGFLELFLLAVGLSMDAFAVAICAGLSTKKVTFQKALIVGLYFGIFQAGMPLIGFFVARLFADQIIAYDHWIAFILLSFLGGKMVYEAIRQEKASKKASEKPLVETSDNESHYASEQDFAGGKTAANPTGCKEDYSLKPAQMLPLAVATSIDALAVGISFAFLQVSVVPAAVLIGVTTLVLSMVGVKIGNVFGEKFKTKAQLAGGIILFLIGLKILLEHLGVISL